MEKIKNINSIILVILIVLLFYFLIWPPFQDSKSNGKILLQEKLVEEAIAQGNFDEARRQVAKIPDDSRLGARRKALSEQIDEAEKKKHAIDEAEKKKHQTYADYIKKAKTALKSGNFDEARENLMKIPEESKIWQDEGRVLFDEYNERKWTRKNIEKLKKESKKNRIKRNITIGMTTDEVIQEWGKPYKINVTQLPGMKSEQWVYGSTYLYFEDGYLTAMQYQK